MSNEIILQGITKKELIESVSENIIKGVITDVSAKFDHIVTTKINNERTYPPYLSKKEAQEYTGLSRSYIDELTERGDIPYIKSDRRVVFRKKDLDSYLNSKEVKIGKNR